MKKLELNTAVKAIFKDGTIKEYTSIEEASNETGISIASIKIRCNKPGTGGKDKTLFEWQDIHTARHYRAKKSKRKGSQYELDIIKDLKNLGYENLSTTRLASKMMDNSKVDIYDPDNILSCYIQCKATANIPSISNITEECPLKDKPLAVFWKQQNTSNKVNEFVCIPKDYFYKLLKNYSIK